MPSGAWNLRSAASLTRPAGAVHASAAAAAALWAITQRLVQLNPNGVARAGFGHGPEAADRLFDAIIDSPSGVVITDDESDGHHFVAHRVDASGDLGQSAPQIGGRRAVDTHRRRVVVRCARRLGHRGTSSRRVGASSWLRRTSE